MWRDRVGVLAIVGILFLSAGVAQAGPIGVAITTTSWLCPQNTIQCSNFPSPTEFIVTDTGLLAGPQGGAVGYTSSLLGNSSSTQIIGNAAQGALSGAATALAVSTNGTAWSLASLQAVWYDEIILSHPFLPVGSPVQLLATHSFSWRFVGNIAVNCGGLNSVAASSQFSLVGAFSDQCISTGDVTATRVIDAFVGDTLSIWGSLGASAYAVDVFGLGGVSLTSDVLHSAHSFIDPITSGLFYTTRSGASYLTAATPVPIPEPGLLSVFGVGLVITTMRGSRMKRRPRRQKTEH